MVTIFFKKGLCPFLILMLSGLEPSYAQSTERINQQFFKSKFFIKVGVSSDYDLTPYWGYNYSLGYGRNIWKNLSLNIFYTHSQTNTLKGAVYYGKYLYPDNPVTISYVNKYLGITRGEYFNGATENGLSVHDILCIKVAYDFRLGKHIYISPFLGLAYGWSKLSTIFLDSANFVNDKLVGGSVGFSYEQGKVFGPDMGINIGYTFKNKHHQLFFEPELILLNTPGNPVRLSTYEAAQFSFGYNYKF
jgi:hypothetical protein